MSQWLRELVTKGTAVSSKRFTAIIIAINLVILSYIATFSIYQCPLHIYDTLALLCGSLFGGTVIEAFVQKKNNDTTKEE